MSKKCFLLFVVLVVACQVIFPVSVWPETFSMKIDNLRSQITNKLPSTVLNKLLEVMKTEKQIKESATLEDVEKTELAKKVLARMKKGEFIAYISGADGKPYLRFSLDKSYVGSRIQIPYEGNPPPEQIEFVLKSLAEELIKNETQKPVKSENKQLVFQEAMARGLSAARQQDFELAVKYFNQAKEADLYSPYVQFNLALAYEKAGGKELLAIACYRSFLAMAPRAANAEQVRKKIIDLEIKVESNIRKLIRTAKDASLTLGNYFEREAATTKHYQYLKRTWGKKEAEEEKNFYRDNQSRKPLEALSMAQVKAGDISGALETSQRIHNEGIQNEIKLKIVEIQIKKGEVAGARQTADGISEKSPYKSPALEMISKFQERSRLRGEPGKRSVEYDPGREVGSWESIIHYDLNKLPIVELKTYLATLKGKELPETVQTLAEAAQHLAEGLEKLRDNEAEWQKMRNDVNK